MRTALALLTLTLLLCGGHALASGDDEAPGNAAPAKTAADAAKAMEQLKERLAALEMETAYLRSREAALTTYILLNEQRANALTAVGAKARQEGFENRKTPTPSRVTLLRGIEALATSLYIQLPTPTKEEATLLKKLAAFRRLKQLDRD